MTITAYRPSRMADHGLSEWLRHQDPLMPLVERGGHGRSWNDHEADWAILLYRGPIVCSKRLRLPSAVARSQAESINRANAGTEFCAVAVLMEGLDLEDIGCEEELADVA